MEFTKLAIPDVVLLTPQVFGDERGFFMETFQQKEFEEACGVVNFVQDNHSKSSKGVLRGLHYQTTQTQGKLVRVVQGEVFDVAVDMRKDSSTFGQWVGATLSAENKQQLWVPAGFAHGFYVTTDTAEFTYKCTDYYHPESEVSVKWDDSDLAIEWPIAQGSVPSISGKDMAGLDFKDAPAF